MLELNCGINISGLLEILEIHFGEIISVSQGM